MEKFALMIAVDDWHDEYDMETKILTTDTKTSSYFHQDPKHDFNHALNIVEKHIHSSILNHQPRTQRPLQFVYNRSDRGEVTCTGFSDGLSVLLHKNKINIMWDT